MNIKDILKVVAGILFTTNGSIATEKKYDSWNVIAQVSSNISGNSSDVAKLIAIGKEDKNILNETSNFNKKARELFDKKGTYYEFLDEDTYLEDIPFAVFKTIMLGYGWMSYMDWKALSDSENMIWALNNMLNSTF